jgi:signal transduction histidine kinase
VFLALIGAVCIGVAVGVISLAVMSPWLGLTLTPAPDGRGVLITAIAADGPAKATGISPGEQLVGIGPRVAPSHTNEGLIRLDPGDLMEEPDTLPSYAHIAAFMQRQSELVSILHQRQVKLLVQATANAPIREIVVEPAPRPMGALPLVFWIQLFSGLSSVFIAGWVSTLSRYRLAGGLFVLSGIFMALSALTAAIYSTRELAIDGTLFAVLGSLNHVGALGFGASMIALFAMYPKRLVPVPLLIPLGLITLTVITLDVTAMLPSPLYGLHLPVVTQMALIIAFIGAQWLAARDEPANRAAMRWMGLSVILGCSMFLGGVAIPMVLDWGQVLTQGYTFAFFAMIYAGIALGIRRYRLFDLGDWSFRILFYAGGAVLFLAVDAILIWLLHVERAPALGIALALVGLIYLPVRDMLARRMLARNDLEQHELVAASLKVAFAPNLAEREGRWHGLLKELFQPAEIAVAAHPVAEAVLDEEGLVLNVPAIAGSPPLRLAYRSQGKALFSPADEKLLAQLLSLIGQADEGRLAYERGVAQERRRIAKDLHDDVGARLLTGLHGVDGQTRPLLQAAISDIRAIVSGLEGEQIALSRALAEIRHETARRLEAAAIALEWPLVEWPLGNLWQAGSQDDPLLDYAQSKALMSAVREIVSNIVRHSGASQVWGKTVLSRQGPMVNLVMDITDNGQGFDAGGDRGVGNGSELVIAKGFGLKNIRERMEEIGGELVISSTQVGTSVSLSLPIDTGYDHLRAGAAASDSRSPAAP